MNIYEKFDKAIKNNHLLLSNALIGKKSESVICITDSSPIEHEMDVKVKNKNLFQPFISNYNKNLYDVTWTVETDGQTFSLNGTATSGGGRIANKANQNTILLKASKTYTLSLHLLSGTATGTTYCHINKASDNTSLQDCTRDNSRTFTVSEDTEVFFGIQITSGAIYENAVFGILLEEGATTTPYAPYIEDLSTVKVIQCGKNILDVANAPMAGNLHPTHTKNLNYERTETGVKYNVINDTNAGWVQIRYQVCPIDMVRGKTITVSFKRTGKEGSNKVYYSLLQAGDDEFTGDYTYKGSGYLNTKSYKDVTSTTLVNGCGEMTYTISSDEIRKNLFVVFYIGSEMDFVAGDVIEYSNIQVEINDKATEYEPYKTPIYYDIEADNSVKNVMGKGEPITLYGTHKGLVIDCNYNRDVNEVYQEVYNAILSLGGNI